MGIVWALLDHHPEGDRLHPVEGNPAILGVPKARPQDNLVGHPLVEPVR